jgi:lipopolysaccharide/colanic/teichoic acid biosynthesis glycosyltransferase
MYSKYIKSLVDYLGAIVLLLVLSWLIAGIAIGFVILWEFPIFFRQRRIGKNNLSFRMWKFRTLSVDDGLPVQLRSFVLGRFLRFTSLDELPQLLNILWGEMSFIGPRPLPEDYLSLYSKEQVKRHEVKPGITGWAQVNGRSDISWQRKFELDLYYVKNISLKLDIVIALKTIALLLSFKKDVSLTEEKFKGN